MSIKLTLLFWIRGDAQIFLAVGNGAESKDDAINGIDAVFVSS